MFILEKNITDHDQRQNSVLQNVNNFKIFLQKSEQRILEIKTVFKNISEYLILRLQISQGYFCYRPYLLKDYMFTSLSFGRRHWLAEYTVYWFSIFIKVLCKT